DEQPEGHSCGPTDRETRCRRGCPYWRVRQRRFGRAELSRLSLESRHHLLLSDRGQAGRLRQHHLYIVVLREGQARLEADGQFQAAEDADVPQAIPFVPGELQSRLWERHARGALWKQLGARHRWNVA